MNLVRIGTRGCRLSLWQANYVAEHLLKGGWNTKIVTIETNDDRFSDSDLEQIGSNDTFAEEIKDQLRKGKIDIAILSAEEMPTELEEGLELIAFTEREDPSNVLISYKTITIDQKFTIGVRSIREVAMIRRFYPHLETVPLRDCHESNIRKMEEGLFDAILLESATAARMGCENLIRYRFPLETMISAAGKGSIIIESHSGSSPKIREAVRRNINHEATELSVNAERTFLRKLPETSNIHGFCRASLELGEIHISGGIISSDGHKWIYLEKKGLAVIANELGIELAIEVLNKGGTELME